MSTSPPSALSAPDESEDQPHAPDAPRRRRSGLKVTIEWTVIIAVAVVGSFLIRTFAVQTFFIPSSSMMPTLHVGDRILVNKLSAKYGTINVGDIIVFKAPPTEHCNSEDVKDLVKRVIGLPGQHLTSQGNTIYVNGAPLNEPWTYWPSLNPVLGNVTVPANSYFVMGDNRANSCDSRFWGSVPRSDIIGKAFARIWPPSRIGFL
ncbi:MAG TPA: signal peptidase I [Acidimicrobiales bacterium]